MSISGILTFLAFTFGIVTARKCQNITVPVTLSARQGIFNLKAPSSDIDMTNFILNSTRQGTNFTQEILFGYHDVSGHFDIAATYCAPDSGHGKVVQVLTHGLGFDRSYWDLSYNNYNYSYVETAVDHYGFSTFSYDRLGLGMSSHGDPVSVIQQPLEEAALYALTMMIRDGKIPNVDCKFSKVVHVGHSFGSTLSYVITRDYPTASDGLVLTGFSLNSSFISYFDLGGNFVPANKLANLSAYPDGYLAAGSPSGVQAKFFAPNDYDPNILSLAFEIQEPATVGELLTSGATGVNNFAGPVIIITGEFDVPFCGGNCLATGNSALPNIPADAATGFPNASLFQTSIVPKTGHGLNLEYSHETTYHMAQQFLVENGL